MLVIVAHRWDPAAAILAGRWAAHDVRVLTTRDLSTRGWALRLHEPQSGMAVIDGLAVPQEEIAGVLTLLPSVDERELGEIELKDRSYVVSEMNAFLTFWLSRLRCPILNKPTPQCLSGPYWRQERWVHEAAKKGIPVQPLRRVDAQIAAETAQNNDSCCTVLSVIGERVLGEADPLLFDYSRRLADLAGVDLMTIKFSSPDRLASFISADTFPDLTCDSVADAVIGYFQPVLASSR